MRDDMFHLVVRPANGIERARQGYTFCRFTLTYDGHFVFCYKEKIEPLDRAIANFKRS